MTEPRKLKDFRQLGVYHTLLPKESQDLLKKAAAEPHDPEQPMKHFMSIRRAIDEVKMRSPQLFKNVR